MILIMTQQKNKEENTKFTLLDEDIEFSLYFPALILAYIVLIITTSITIQVEAGNIFLYDEWVSLIIFFTLQLIFTQKMKLRENDTLFTLIPFISLALIGLFTVNIDNSIYIYLTMIFFVLAMNYKAIIKGENLNLFCLLTIALLGMGRFLIYLSDIDTNTALNYYFEGMLIFFTLFFSFLNYKFNKNELAIDGSKHRISPILLCLFLLYFITSQDLSLGYFIIPIILLFAAYISCGVLTFNLAYLIMTYNIFKYISSTETYPEIFVISSLILFFFAIVHEITDKKRMLAISTAVISSIVFIISIAVTHGSDIVTTLVWAGFGIFAIIVGIKSNTYYFRWIGLFCLLSLL